MLLKRTTIGVLAACLGCGSEGSSADPGATSSGGSTASMGGNVTTAGGGVDGHAGATGGSVVTSGGSAAAGAAVSAGSGGIAEGGGVGGSFVPGGSAGAPAQATIDCGPQGVVIENAGPVKNRVNYVILGDGYDATTVETTFIEHVKKAMPRRFNTPVGEPYGRYRKFVNICAIKIVSQTSGIGKGPTAFSCTGDDDSRLANCDEAAADAALDKAIPPTLEVDWHAIVLNNDRWWNTGSPWMLWSGGHADAPGAALHEGGHGFHQLADEYSGTQANDCGEHGEVNSTADGKMTNGKWNLWLDHDAADATGKQGIFQGSRYCPESAAQYRPSDNSMMNMLFDKPECAPFCKDTSFNSVSREKIVMDIWRIVKPVDSVEPPEGSVAGPVVLRVNVVDPAVINVDWSLDGTVIKKNGGESYDVAAAKLTSGQHTIMAKAYDNAGDDLVRNVSGCADKTHCWARDSWKNSQQTVTWSVTVP